MCSLVSKSIFIFFVSFICGTIAKSDFRGIKLRPLKKLFSVVLEGSHQEKPSGLRQVEVTISTKGGLGGSAATDGGTHSTVHEETIKSTVQIATKPSQLAIAGTLSTFPAYMGGEVPVEDKLADFVTACPDATCRSHTWQET